MVGEVRAEIVGSMGMQIFFVLVSVLSCLSAFVLSPFRRLPGLYKFDWNRIDSTATHLTFLVSPACQPARSSTRGFDPASRPESVQWSFRPSQVCDHRRLTRRSLASSLPVPAETNTSQTYEYNIAPRLHSRRRPNLLLVPSSSPHHIPQLGTVTQ